MSSGNNQYTNAERLKIVRDFVKENPTMPAQTAGRHLFHKHPKHFQTINAARCAVRLQFGASGEKNRCLATVPREKRQAGEDWRKYLPEALPREPWKPFVIPSPARVLGLFDIHIPFHDNKAIKLAIEYGLERKADVVLLGGDVVDHYALSRFSKDPALRDFAGEVRAARQFLKAVRSAFPKARIIWKHGNHEERYEVYMRAMAPDFIGVEAFEWSNVFGLKEYGVEMVGEKRPIKLGKLNLLHGHEYGGGAYAPVAASRSMFLKATAHTMSGHLHRVDHHSKPTLDGTLISNWSVGCLCDPKPDYRPLNDWSQGFAFVDVDARGAFRVENLRIVDGRAW